MRLCRFGNDRLGVVDGNQVRDVTSALDALPSYRHPLPAFDVVIANLDLLKPEIDAVAAESTPLRLDDLTAPEPGCESRQDRRRASQLPEAPRRGPR